MHDTNFVQVVTILGSLGEFLGSIGVIATLIYLAVQIKESKKATEASIVWERAKAMREVSMIWLTSPEASHLIHEFGMLSSQEEFDEKYNEAASRGFQYLSVNRTVVQTLEASYLTAHDQAEKQKIRERLRFMLETTPGFRWTWQRTNTPGGFNTEFVRMFDEEIRMLEGGT